MCTTYRTGRGSIGFSIVIAESHRLSVIVDDLRFTDDTAIQIA